jgi:hypothetical protein
VGSLFTVRINFDKEYILWDSVVLISENEMVDFLNSAMIIRNLAGVKALVIGLLAQQSNVFRQGEFIAFYACVDSFGHDDWKNR